MSYRPSPAFITAQHALENLRQRPDNLTLLRLYALYKQTTIGDAPLERPGITDIRGRFKHDAWTSLKGLPQREAEEQYIALAEALSQQTASL
jgi:acyl-CoA-binding protein